LENAAKQLKAQNKIGGQIPPRVLKEVLAEGYFCEDELQAMYLGGVLASSKGPVSRDDRAIAYCSLVNSLSSYQLRTHCILYSTLLRGTHYYLGTPIPLKDSVSHWIKKHGLTVLRVVDIFVRIVDGSFHKTDSSELAFRMAGIFAMKDAIEKADPILIE
jgi:translation elongation factor EF-G